MIYSILSLAFALLAFTGLKQTSKDRPVLVAGYAVAGLVALALSLHASITALAGAAP